MRREIEPLVLKEDNIVVKFFFLVYEGGRFEPLTCMQVIEQCLIPVELLRFRSFKI